MVLRIALIGYGKMGQAIDRLASSQNCTIVARLGRHDPINQETLSDANVCIDFTHASRTLKNTQAVHKLKCPLVIGTTGWEAELHRVKELSQYGILYGSNFSIGVNLLYRLVDHASKLISHFTEYDVSGVETHHRLKKDSPSGTAKEISQILIKNLPQKKHLSTDPQTCFSDPEALLFSSIRCGSDPGQHSIIFDSQNDRITLTQEARNRDSYALGSFLAAKWIVGKKEIYTMTELVDEIINTKEPICP